jgi:hypothetical protein
MDVGPQLAFALLALVLVDYFGNLAVLLLIVVALLRLVLLLALGIALLIVLFLRARHSSPLCVARSGAR